MAIFGHFVANFWQLFGPILTLKVSTKSIYNFEHFIYTIETNKMTNFSNIWLRNIFKNGSDLLKISKNISNKIDKKVLFNAEIGQIWVWISTNMSNITNWSLFYALTKIDKFHSETSGPLCDPPETRSGIPGSGSIHQDHFIYSS